MKRYRFSSWPIFVGLVMVALAVLSLSGAIQQAAFVGRYAPAGTSGLLLLDTKTGEVYATDSKLMTPVGWQKLVHRP